MHHQGPIDRSHLDQYVFGDRALLDEILTIFIDQASAWIARMDPELCDREWHLAAHTLKGASRGVGAWALGDLAEEAERLVGAGQSERRRAINSKLRDATAAAVAHAREIRDIAA
jgi:HPt (histidine-containing phosphotransfer) domain-containing protein